MLITSNLKIHTSFYFSITNLEIKEDHNMKLTLEKYTVHLTMHKEDRSPYNCSVLFTGWGAH